MDIPKIDRKALLESDVRKAMDRLAMAQRLWVVLDAHPDTLGSDRLKDRLQRYLHKNTRDKDARFAIRETIIEVTAPGQRFEVDIHPNVLDALRHDHRPAREIGASNKEMALWEVVANMQGMTVEQFMRTAVNLFAAAVGQSAIERYRSGKVPVKDLQSRLLDQYSVQLADLLEQHSLVVGEFVRTNAGSGSVPKSPKPV